MSKQTYSLNKVNPLDIRSIEHKTSISGHLNKIVIRFNNDYCLSITNDTSFVLSNHENVVEKRFERVGNVFEEVLESNMNGG